MRSDVCPYNPLLETTSPQRHRWSAFGISLAFHGLGLGFVLLLGILFPVEMERVAMRSLVYLQLAPPPLQEAPVPKPPVHVLRFNLPKSPPPPTQASLLAPALPVPHPKSPEVAPRVQPADPVPSLPTIAPPKRELPPVRVGVLGGGVELATLKLPVREVQTGGFGSPTGLKGEPVGGSQGNVPKVGSFDLPPGEGYGNGSGGTHGARGTVASAGFGPGIASPGQGSEVHGGSRQAGVQMAGFDVKPTATPAPQRRATEAPTFRPVEVISKPNPVYTEEGRRLGIQGEVVLSVVFAATGKLQVLAVEQGLGHGLDQAAWRAAEQIRYRPAQRDGQPVDFPATLRVVFELAN